MDIETLSALMRKGDNEVHKFMDNVCENFKDENNLGEVILQINSPIAENDRYDPTPWTATVDWSPLARGKFTQSGARSFNNFRKCFY